MLRDSSLHVVQVQVCLGAIRKGHDELWNLNGDSMTCSGHILIEIISKSLDFVVLEGALINCVAHFVVSPCGLEDDCGPEEADRLVFPHIMSTEVYADVPSIVERRQKLVWIVNWAVYVKLSIYFVIPITGLRAEPGVCIIIWPQFSFLIPNH